MVGRALLWHVPVAALHLVVEAQTSDQAQAGTTGRVYYAWRCNGESVFGTEAGHGSRNLLLDGAAMGSAAVVVAEASCLPDALQLSSDAADEWGFWKLSFSAPELGDAVYTCASDPHLKAGTPLGSGGFWVGGGTPTLTVYCANALPTVSPSALTADAS